MDITDNTLDFNKICRLCLTEETVMSSIYNEDDTETNSVPLPLRIMSCVSVEVSSNDGLPSQICATCLCQVDGWYKFKDLCENSDLLLRKCIKNEPVQIDSISQVRTMAQEVKKYFSSQVIKDESEAANQNKNLSPKKKMKSIMKLFEDQISDNSIMKDDENEDEEGERDEETDNPDKKTKKPKIKSPDNTEIDELGRIVYKCSICPSKYVSESAREKHEGKHKETLQCDICNRTLANRVSLKNHRALHLGQTKYACEFCGKGCVSKAHYVAHLRKHTEEKPFPCTVCDKRFSSNSNLLLHLRMHKGEKRHFCDICGHATVTKSNLNSHMRRHYGERNHVCHICGKGFLSKDTLKRHFTAHSDVRSYQCNLCDARFKVSKSLSIHLKSVHMKIKPHKCDICDKGFSRKSNLKEHMQTHNRNRFKINANTSNASVIVLPYNP